MKQVYKPNQTCSLLALSRSLSRIIVSALNTIIVITLTCSCVIKWHKSISATLTWNLCQAAGCIGYHSGKPVIGALAHLYLMVESCPPTEPYWLLQNGFTVPCYGVLGKERAFLFFQSAIDFLAEFHIRVASVPRQQMNEISLRFLRPSRLFMKRLLSSFLRNYTFIAFL